MKLNFLLCWFFKIIILFFMASAYAKYDRSNSLTFSHTKKFLVKLYRDQLKDHKTVYCNAPIKWVGKKGLPQLDAINYTIRKQETRANRIEWEHIMPAHTIASHGTLPCWKHGGRSNCRKKDLFFRKAEGDPHNLFPAIGEVNGDRSDFVATEWETNVGAYYGGCPAKVDFKKQRFEPPSRVKGVISRAYLYMASQYNIQLDKDQIDLYRKWNATYPPEAWECERQKLVADWFGVENKLVQEKCLTTKLK